MVRTKTLADLFNPSPDSGIIHKKIKIYEPEFWKKHDLKNSKYFTK